jgi:hypothetical protein
MLTFNLAPDLRPTHHALGTCNLACPFLKTHKQIVFLILHFFFGVQTEADFFIFTCNKERRENHLS